MLGNYVLKVRMKKPNGWVLLKVPLMLPKELATVVRKMEKRKKKKMLLSLLKKLLTSQLFWFHFPVPFAIITLITEKKEPIGIVNALKDKIKVPLTLVQIVEALKIP